MIFEGYRFFPIFNQRYKTLHSQLNEYFLTLFFDFVGVRMSTDLMTNCIRGFML